MNTHKALSIRQPWAHAILHLGKDVENRTWRTNFRGRFLIHSSKKLGFDGHDIDFFRRLGYTGQDIIEWANQPRGAIVGSVELVDCVKDYKSVWAAEGQYHFILKDPVAFDKPIEYKGQLKFFDVRPSIISW